MRSFAHLMNPEGQRRLVEWQQGSRLDLPPDAAVMMALISARAAAGSAAGQTGLPDFSHLAANPDAAAAARAMWQTMTKIQKPRRPSAQPASAPAEQPQAATVVVAPTRSSSRGPRGAQDGGRRPFFWIDLHGR